MIASELVQALDSIIKEYGDIQVCMDYANPDIIFNIRQVLVECGPTPSDIRAVLCHNEYIFDKPILTLVKDDEATDRS